jgi:4-hydroxy-tetrahydrodipicolinate synthase
MARYQGSWVALATPFRGGRLDEAAYRALCEEQMAAGTDGLIPCGTTGEGGALSPEETSACVRIAADVAHRAGKPVFAGAGTAITASTIDNVRRVKEAGADGALVVTPYYVKPTQAGVVEHFRAIAAAVPRFPLIAYNVPGRTQFDLLPETYPALAQVEEVVAVKESTGSMQRVADIREKVGDRFTLLSGDDFSLAGFLATGGHGVISVSANVVPELIARLIHAGLAGDFRTAADIQVRTASLHRTLFAEANPIPVKAALHLLGRFADEIRLPLTPATPATRERLRRDLSALGKP